MGCTTTGGGGYWVLEASPGMSLEEREEELVRQTVLKSCFISDQNLVEIWYRESTPTPKELEGWGAKVTVRDVIRTGRAGAYMIRGTHMMTALNNQIARQHNINVLENAIVTKLLTNKGRVIGATVLDTGRGEFIVVKAKAVVLATGGPGMLYRPAEVTPLDMYSGVTGDGHALA
jgi:succinate dehydrogenase/fumarate reductase flavoprotein subunit